MCLNYYYPDGFIDSTPIDKKVLLEDEETIHNAFFDRSFKDEM